MNFIIQPKEISAIKNVACSDWKNWLSQIEKEQSVKEGILIPPMLAKMMFNHSDPKQRSVLEGVFPKFGDQRFETILGREYPVDRMPDGKIWTLCNLIHPDLGFFHDGLELWQQQVEGTLHNKIMLEQLYQQLEKEGKTWRVPTDDVEHGDSDWQRFFDAIGPDAGTKLKSQAGWAHGGNGTDEFAFSVVPAGNRSSNGGRFYYRGYYGLFWSSSVASGTYAWYRTFNYGNSQVERSNSNRSHGFSVRCVRD